MGKLYIYIYNILHINKNKENKVFKLYIFIMYVGILSFITLEIQN